MSIVARKQKSQNLPYIQEVEDIYKLEKTLFLQSISKRISAKENLCNNQFLLPSLPCKSLVLMSVLDLLKSSLPTKLIPLLLSTVKPASCQSFENCTCTMENSLVHRSYWGSDFSQLLNTSNPSTHRHTFQTRTWTLRSYADMLSCHASLRKS